MVILFSACNWVGRQIAKCCGCATEDKGGEKEWGKDEAPAWDQAEVEGGQQREDGYSQLQGNGQPKSKQSEVGHYG